MCEYPGRSHRRIGVDIFEKMRSRLLRLKLYFLKCGPLRSAAVRRRARRLGAPVQELPNAHKLVRLYRLPLRGRRGHVPALQGLLQIRTHLCRVGTCPHRCRNFRLRTNLFVCTVCRFAVGGDMSPPYGELYDNDRERLQWYFQSHIVVSILPRKAFAPGHDTF